MPIDPSIIAGIRPAPIQNPLEAISTIAQLQGIREQTEARRLAAEKARQQAMDDAAIRRVMTEAGGDWEKALPQLRTIAPSAAAKLETDIAETRNKTLEGLKTRHDLAIKQLGIGAQILETVNDQQSLDVALPMIATMSPEIAQQLGPTYDPARVAQFRQIGLTQKDLYERKQDAVKLLTEGKATEAMGTWLSTINPADPQAATQWDQAKAGARAMGVPAAVLAQFGDFSPEAPARAGQLAIAPAKRAELAGQAEARGQTAAGQAQTAAHQAVVEQQGAQRIAIARQRLAQGGGTSTDKQDVEAIADAIISGDQPPTLTGLYRYAAPIRGELARRGYDLATAQTDWTAAQRHFATLNGAQQTRLRQAVDTATHSLEVIDTLAGKWKGGKYPLLNRANLALAKGGAYGSDVATVANQLDAQIADVTSELANAYMGGNSPTDHALQLAAKNLSADWDEKVLKDMVKLARTNLQIRANAIKNTGVIGASAQNPYAPPPPPPSPNGAKAPAKVGERRTINGQLAEWDGTGWKAVR